MSRLSHLLFIFSIPLLADGKKSDLDPKVLLREIARHGADSVLSRTEGEIDLVALQGETLVFVEVKLRTSRKMGAAVQAVSPAKGARLRELAEAYSADHPELPPNLRIDLVAIELTVGGEVGQLNHVQNAVEG